MSDMKLPDVPLPSYCLRGRKINIEEGKFIFNDIGLVSRTKESALLEIKNFFNSGSLRYSQETVYYLVESAWTSAGCKNADTSIKEFILDIKEKGQYDWIVALVRV